MANWREEIIYKIYIYIYNNLTKNIFVADFMRLGGAWRYINSYNNDRNQVHKNNTILCTVHNLQNWNTFFFFNYTKKWLLHT
jgi:hypothetical protein